MKGVIYTMRVGLLNNAYIRTYNPRTKKYTDVQKPLTRERINEFKRSAPDRALKELNSIMPGLLRKGGFIYDQSLYKNWRFVQKGMQEIKLIVDITFTDDNNIGKSAFMRLINKTGILNYDIDLKKSYGTI